MISYVWEVLAGCENADFIEDDKWKVHDRDYLSFVVYKHLECVCDISVRGNISAYAIKANLIDHETRNRIVDSRSISA